MADTKLIPIADIRANTGQIPGVKANPRSIKGEKYEKLKKSLQDNPEMLDLRELLVYEHEGKYVCIGGNMRYRACKELGLKDVPCKVIPPTATPDQLNAYIIKDNSGFGEWDWDMLANEWDEDLLDDWGVDVWQEEAEEEKDEAEAKEDEFDEDKEQIESRCKKGDIWQCGVHRLMCGDSTDAASVALLMNGERADITFTSPPYNAGSINQKGNPSTHKKYNEYDDNKSGEKYLTFLIRNVSLMLEYSSDVFYNIGLVEGNKREIVKLQMRFLDQYKDVIYWEKDNCAPHIQSGVINNLVEFILCFGDGHRKFKNAQFSQGTYWNVIKGSNASGNEYAKIHKATFPLYLPENIIKNFCPKGGSVIDCFGGSGTTMIACEQLGRKCFMMELDPHYCDVILARWEKLTGKEAVKIQEHDAG